MHPGHPTPMRAIVRLTLLAALLLGLLPACTPTPIPGPGGTAQLTILYTNDEHGWMAPTDNIGGAAGLMQRWREDEGYTEDGPFLIVSGGDIWTGPALSSWFDGESMVDVMNVMGYTAIALGNHEFDFGREGLRERMAEAEFAFLGANVTDTATGERADFALPYVIEEVGDVRVGIVGLASQRTPRTTMPTHVAGLKFEAYGPTLAQVVPQVWDEGADVVIVLSHLCSMELDAVAAVAADLGVAMIGGGHCHERISRTRNGVALVGGGWRMEAYGRVDLTVDLDQNKVLEATTIVKSNPPGEGDAEVAAQVATWQAQLDDALLVAIGYTRDGIARNSAAMWSLTMRAWLAGYPADIAMTNPGSYRQDFDRGEITLADVVGLWPFNNVLVDAALTGKQVIASYEHGNRRPAVAGLTREGGEYFVNGEPLDPEATYHVLINDYMYAGGDGYQFATYDPDAYQTGIDWRQPVIEYISGLNTTAESPIEGYLENR